MSVQLDAISSSRGCMDSRDQKSDPFRRPTSELSPSGCSSPLQTTQKVPGKTFPFLAGTHAYHDSCAVVFWLVLWASPKLLEQASLPGRSHHGPHPPFQDRPLIQLRTMQKAMGYGGPADPVFLHPTERKPISYSVFSALLKKASLLSGIRPPLAGLPMKAVMGLGGHTSEAGTSTARKSSAS